MATTAQDTFKTTLAFDVSCRSTHASSIHGQTHLLDLMHPCLNVDEIARLIAHELVASGGKATAVGLACCCKSLEDPALDALWAKQVSLLPLLKSSPGDVLWSGIECTVSISTTYFFFFS